VPIGEDIPLLIPISIILVVFIVFLVSLFSNFIDQNEVVRMSQTSITTGNYFIELFSDEKGSLVLEELNRHNSCKNKCCNFKSFGFYSNFKTNVKIESGGVYWCWSNVNSKYDTSPEKRIVNSFPVLIADGYETEVGKVTVGVWK